VSKHPETERPDLSHMSVDDLAALLIGCSMSNDATDKQFAKFCRDEISKRKPAINRARRRGKHD